MSDKTNNHLSLENSSDGQEENDLVKPIVTYQNTDEQVVTEEINLNIPNNAIKLNIKLARENGFTIAPIAPYYPITEYPQTNKDTGEVTPKFTGKRISFIDSRNHPVMVDKWEVFKTTFAGNKTLEMWFAHPDMGIALIGTEYSVLYDLDKKNFDSKEECDTAFFTWKESVETLTGKKFLYGKTQGGGWRLPIKLIEPCKFTNFTHEQGSKNHVGEIRGKGKYAVVCLDKTESGKPYTWENDAPILEVTCLEEISIYSTAQVSESSLTDVKEFAHMGNSDDALNIKDLLSKRNQAISNGESEVGKRSDDLTALIKDVLGWQIWLEINQLEYLDNIEELLLEAANSLDVDENRLNRIRSGLTGNYQPACLYEGNEADCWKKIKYASAKVNSDAYSKCPKHIRDEIEGLEGVKEFLANQNKTKFAKSGGHTPRLTKAPEESIVADQLVEMYKTKLAWDGNFKRWMIYQDDANQLGYGIYKPLEEEEVDKIIVAYLKTQGYAYKGGYPASVKRLLSSELWVRKFYTIQQNKLPLIDGVLNLSTNELEPHCQANRFDFCLPYQWSKRGVGCKPVLDWLLWFCDGDELKRELLLAWMNCIVLNKVNYQKFLILTGAGGAGKGTFLRLCTALIGAANTADTTLPAMENNRFETATYRGKKFITVNEVENFSGSLTVLKNITGQDNIRFEEKYKQGGSAPIPALLMIAANHDLNASENSSAIFRRRISLDFKKVISDSEKRNLITFDPDKNPTGDFVPYLAGLLDYVLAMNPERVRQLITETNRYVPSVNKTAMEVTANSSNLAEWTNYQLVVSPKDKFYTGCLKTPTSDVILRATYANPNQWLYPNYVAYCEARNYKPLSLVKFSKNLEDLLVHQLKLDVTKGKDKHGAYFKGIALRTDKDTDSLLLTGECESTPISESEAALQSQVYDLSIPNEFLKYLETLEAEYVKSPSDELFKQLENLNPSIDFLETA